MLIVEVNPITSERTVVFQRDWHTSRLSQGYVPLRKNYVEGKDMFRLQKALLKHNDPMPTSEE